MEVNSRAIPHMIIITRIVSQRVTVCTQGVNSCYESTKENTVVPCIDNAHRQGLNLHTVTIKVNEYS